MSHTGKLYQYYLKKSLWRSWRLWGAIALCWVWWVAYSWLGAHGFRKGLKEQQSFRILWTEQELDQEFSWKGMLEKNYQGGMIFDEESVEWWENQADKAEEPAKAKKYRLFAQNLRDGNIWKKAKKNAKNLPKEAKWKANYLSNNFPFYEALTEFSARQARLDREGIGKKIELVHHLSLWNMSGIILGSFLAYSLLSSLFIEAKKNGEDALVLNLSPGVERSHLLAGKILASLSNLAIYAFLGLVLPYTVFLFVFGPGITSWGTYLLFVSWTTFLGPVLFLLFPAALYLATSLWGMAGKIIQFLLHYFSIGWAFLNLAAGSAPNSEGGQESGGGLFSTVAKIEYYYYHPLVHISFVIILGGLLLLFYCSYYQQEDLG